jgi:hypothetical protein
MEKAPQLATERLLLRPFRRTDGARVEQLAGAREVADTTLTIPHPYPTGGGAQWIATHADAWKRRENLALAICTAAPSSELVGRSTFACRWRTGTERSAIGLGWRTGDTALRPRQREPSLGMASLNSASTASKAGISLATPRPGVSFRSWACVWRGCIEMPIIAGTPSKTSSSTRCSLRSGGEEAQPDPVTGEDDSDVVTWISTRKLYRRDASDWIGESLHS